MNAYKSSTSPGTVASRDSNTPLRFIRRVGTLALLAAALAGQQCLGPLPPDNTAPITTVQAKPTVRLATSKGDIVLELFPQQAPLAVDNFLQYVRDGFYDGTIVHNATANTSVTAGTYDGSLAAKVTRGPIANESNNGLSNLRGRVGVVEPNGTGSGTSAFLIHLSDDANSDFDLATGQRGMTVFGQVVEGMDVADAIGQVATATKQTADGGSISRVPSENIFINQATIDNSQATGDNTAPVAEAGPDQAIQTGDLVILDGSGSSDPDGDTITFHWRQTAGPPVTLSRTDVTSPNFTPAAVARLTFELTVTDEQGATSTDSVNVVVNTIGNQPPVANAGPDQRVVAGGMAMLDASSSSDPDLQTLTYNWTQAIGSPVTLSDPAAVKPTFTVPSVTGRLIFTLTVTDSMGGQATDSVTLDVEAGTPANAGADQNVLTSEAVTLHGGGEQGAALAWTQVSGAPVALSDPDLAEPTFAAPADQGQLVFRVTTTNANGAVTSDEVNVNVFTQTASGLKYCDEVRGTGALVEPNSTVSALYTGRLDDQNGAVFDSTSQHGDQPIDFSLTGVIAGWTEGLGNYDMHAGGKRLLIIPPDLGYGDQDKPGIPPNSTLWFEVEVVSVQ